jgi:hypothetical protein
MVMTEIRQCRGRQLGICEGSDEEAGGGSHHGQTALQDAVGHAGAIISGRRNAPKIKAMRRRHRVAKSPAEIGETVVAGWVFEKLRRGEPPGSTIRQLI